MSTTTTDHVIPLSTKYVSVERMAEQKHTGVARHEKGGNA